MVAAPASAVPSSSRGGDRFTLAILFLLGGRAALPALGGIALGAGVALAIIARDRSARA